MKRILSALAIFAAASIALISCHKAEVDPKGEDNKDPQKQEETTGIYIYGTATITGLNLETMEAFAETSGLYSWEGYLKAGLPFKFPTQKTAEWPAYMVDEDGETIVYGKSDDDLVIYTVGVDGTYEIIIDTRDENNLICTIDLITPDLSNVEFTELYLLGDATSAGWALAAMEQFDRNGAIFTWEGPLKAGLRFRFPLQKDPGTSVDDAKWWPCLCCHEGGVIKYAMGDADESNVPVDEDGIYKIVVNTTDHENMSYTIELKNAGLPDPEITNLWLLGDAAPCGWALDLMPEFENNDGIFTWTGTIKASGQFRMNTVNNNWFPAIVIERATGKAVYCENWDEEVYDMFSVDVTADYTITVDAKKFDNITVSVVLAGEAPAHPTISELYILGDATDNGWALDTMPQFANDNGVFTWQGNLKAAGEFRFPTQRVANVWWPCLVLNEDATKVVYDEDGSKYVAYHVAADGEYKIVIDTKDFDNMTCSISAVGSEPVTPKYTELYILGDATDNGWALDTMPAFTNDNGVFTWTGFLKAAGEFRFPVQRIANTWWPCLVLNADATKVVYDEDGSKYVAYHVAEDGKYTIVVDTRNEDDMTCTITRVYDNSLTELYILGDATDNGWSLDTMPAFANDDAIFTWEGHLKAAGGFRFPLQKVANMWFPCLCLETATGKLVKTTDTDWNTGAYAHLSVLEDANYKIVINGKDADNISYTITKL